MRQQYRSREGLFAIQRPVLGSGQGTTPLPALAVSRAADVALGDAELVDVGRWVRQARVRVLEDLADMDEPMIMRVVPCGVPDEVKFAWDSPGLRGYRCSVGTLEEVVADI